MIKRVRDRVDITLVVLAVVVGLLAFVAWQQEGWALARAGAWRGVKELLNVAPLLFVAFLVAGLTQVLVTEEVVRRWLGTESGWRGILLAALGGALMPGGPYVYYPIAAVLLRSGAGVGSLVAFVTAKNLWSLSRLPLEFALLGPYLTLVRLVATMWVPPVMGFLAHVLFADRIEAIREAMGL